MFKAIVLKCVRLTLPVLRAFQGTRLHWGSDSLLDDSSSPDWCWIHDNKSTNSDRIYVFKLDRQQLMWHGGYPDMPGHMLQHSDNKQEGSDAEARAAGAFTTAGQD